MSRALLNPILDWLALRVACVVPSSVRLWEEPFERPLPDLIVDLLQPFVPPGLCGREPAGCG